MSADGTASRLLGSHQGEPGKIVTDKLKSYGVAHRELISEAIHSSKQNVITGQSNRTKTPGYESAGCGGPISRRSNQLVRRRDFWVLMQLHPICTSLSVT